MSMHIDFVPNHGSKPTPLLRETYRDGKKIRKRTIANLSKLSDSQVKDFRKVLKGIKMVPAGEAFDVVSSRFHGNVQAVRMAMKKLGFERLLHNRKTKERDLITAMVAARLLEPESSKLETTRWWGNTTLPSIMGVGDAEEDDLYQAMDWLLKRQPAIEKKLAKRHLQDGGLVLYDLTSSYFEGHCCPLAKRGYNRDRKKGKLQVNYGVLTDDRGCPVAVSVFDGNTTDSKTLLPQVTKLRDVFGLEYVAVVGDRGMITQAQIEELKKIEGMHWITALKHKSLRKLIEGQALQLGLFDQRNLFEFSHEKYPGERLVACRNPELAKHSTEKRLELIGATEKELHKIQSMVKNDRLKGQDKIGVRVGRVINKYKVAKYFKLVIRDDEFAFSCDQNLVSKEAFADGIYVIRTSLPRDVLDADGTVRSYKSLSQVERGFRTMKGIDIKVRPIRHYLEDRVKAHIFLCMLAYYVQWHMMSAWRPLLFADQELSAKKERDPVAPAKRSNSALDKIATKRLPDGSVVHSFHSLLALLQTVVRNTCRCHQADTDDPTFEIDTLPNKTQQTALELLTQITL